MTPRDPWTRGLDSVGLLILRLGIGGYMLSHGSGKLQMLLAGEFDRFGDPIGLGNGASLALVTFAEFACAGLLMLGLATRLAAVPLVVTMSVAAFVAHAGDPWTMGRAAQLFTAGEAASWASKEPALLYGTAFLTLLLTGPGAFSLDALLWPRLAARLGAREDGRPASEAGSEARSAEGAVARGEQRG